MTVSTTAIDVSYTGDGTTTAFAVPYEFLDASDLVVTVAGVLLVLNSGYTVTGGSGSTGTVTMTNAPASAAAVKIERVVPLTQETDYQRNDAFPAETHERALDKLTQIVQQIKGMWSKAFRFSDATVAAVPVASALSKYPYIDATGALTFVTGDPSQPMTHTAEVVTATAGQTVIPVSAYTPGAGDLLVFKNGALLTPGVQYTETTSTTYTLATPATLGDTLVNVIGAVFDVSLARMDSPQESVTGLTTPTLTLTTMSYVPGVDRVWVFMNGAKLDPGSYTPASSTTITLGFTPVASDVFDVVVGTAININKVLVQPVDSLTIVSDGNTSQMLFAGPRGAVSRPEMNNILGCFNAAPKGVPPGTNVAWSVLRVWDADIVASDAGTRRGLGMEAHFDSDSVMRTRLVTRSEGSPSKKHTDVYYQLNGCNIQYIGAKREGSTGTGSIGFYPRGMTFDTTAYASWMASTGVTMGQKRLVSRSDYIVLECTTAGTTGATEPIPAQIGGTVVDGTVTWTSRSRLLPTTSTAVALWLDENGNVGVNTDAPDKGFDVATYARFQSGICGHAVTSAISGGLLTVDAETGNLFDVTVSTASAFTVTAPSNPNVGARITYRLKNTSGGAMGTVTWDAIYKMASWTSPATNYSRSIDFVYIGTNWVEVSRTPADIPN